MRTQGPEPGAVASETVTGPSGLTMTDFSPTAMPTRIVAGSA